MKKGTKILCFLLALCLLFGITATTVLARGTDEGSVSEALPDAMPAIREAFSAHEIQATERFDDGYIGMDVELTVYFDSTHDFIYSYNGTPLVLYVVNTRTERVGTDSDVEIITEMLARGYLVAVLDYKNDARAVSPALEWSTQAIRTRLLNGEFFGGTEIDPTGKFAEGYVVPAGYQISNGHVFWEIDKHGADGSLEKIVEIWNNDFRGVKGETVIYWLDAEGNRKPTQNAHDGSAPVWEDESHIKIKYTKAETVYDCVKKDGTFIDLNLYMAIVYPTNPEKDVPVFSYASCGENLLRFWNVSYAPHLTGFLFAGYAGVMYDYCYTPMARNDHYGYYDGDASKGHISGDNQTYSLDVYNEKKTNTAAMRYIRYLADTEPETFAFDTEHIGVIGHSKSGVVTFLGAEHPELFDEVRYFPDHHGETRYENGLTEDDAYGLIDGGEEQPWLTYSDGTEISSRANFVCASAGSRGELIGEGHSPTFIVGAMSDVAYHQFYPNILNALETYDVPALNLRVAELAHQIPHGIDCDHGLDTYQELMKQAHYWLRGDAAEVVWITPSHKTTDVSVTEKISVKFNGSISREQIDKVTVINREKGTVATGRWESKFGDTLWEFYPDALDGGYVYTVTVPDTIVDSVNSKALAAPKQISFRTRYEVTDAPTIVGENMHLTLTDSTSSGVYFLFDKIRESEKYLLRFQAENNAHNKVLVYTLCEIDRENLSESTCSAEPIGEILLSDEGYYELDVTDAVKAAEEEIGFYLALGKVEGQTIVYNKDFESSEVGNYKLPKDLYYEAWCDGVISDEMDSVALKVKAMLHNGDRTVAGKDYTAKFVNNTFYENPRPALTIGATFSPDTLEESDYGRTYRFSIRIFDTTSRLVVFKVGELSVKSDLELVDYKPMQFSFFTKANEWSTFTFEFTLDNPDYWNGLFKNKVTLMLDSSGNLERPLYIDDITLVETVTDLTVSELSLVSYPTEDTVLSPKEQVSFDADGNQLDTLVLGADKVTYEGHGAKAYVQYGTSSLDPYAGKYTASFHVATSSSATVKVYGLDGEKEWSADTLNYFNAVANDRFSGGVDPDAVYLGKEIAALTIDATGTYSADITEYVKYMVGCSAKTITLILVAEDSTGLMKLTPINGTIVFYDNYEDGTLKRIWPNNGDTELNASDIIVRGTEDYPAIASKKGLSANATPFGKDSLRMAFTSSSTAIKLFNIFGKNLTEEDIGDTYTIRFSLSTDAESFTVRYGLMSSTGRYASPYTGDKLYNPITGTASSANKELMVELSKNEWTDVEFTFKVTGAMVDSYTDESGNNVSNKIPYSGDETQLVHCNYALLAFLAKTSDKNVNVFVDDILVEKHADERELGEYGIVSSFDYDDVTLNPYPGVAINGISLGIDEYCPEYTSVIRSTSHPTLSSEYDHTTGSGKSLVMTMDNKNAMLKIPNLFGKNLTEDDLGDYYTITFWVNTDIDSMRFVYGFASSTTRYQSPYTGDKIYDPVQNKTGNIYAPKIAKNTWTKFTYTFPITESMLGSHMNQTFEYEGNTYTSHCNYALLVFRAWYDSYSAGGEYVNSHLYIDDITVTKTLKDGSVPATEDFSMDEREYTSVESSGNASAGLIGGSVQQQEGGNTTAYFTFNKGSFVDCERATLSVPFVGESSVSVSVWGIKDPTTYDGVFTADKAYRGVALCTAQVDADGTVRLDVTDYVKANREIGYGFVLVCESIGGASSIGFDTERITLTENVDYTTLGGATTSMTGGKLSVNASAANAGVIFYNVFGSDNAVATVGKCKVQMTLAGAGTVRFAIADAEGKLLAVSPELLLADAEQTLSYEFAVDYSLCEQGTRTVGVISSDATEFSISSLAVSMESDISLAGASLSVALPPIGNALVEDITPLSNVTLYTDFVYNIYFPILDELRSLMLDGKEYTNLEALRTEVVNGKKYYMLSVPLGATEALSEIALTAILEDSDGNEVEGSWSFSMQSYAARLLTGNYSATSKTLLRDILSYIKSAYLYFEKNEADEAVRIVDALIGASYDANALPDVEVLPMQSTEGLKAATLLIDTAPAFAFLPATNADGSLIYAPEQYHFYLDGTPCEVKLTTLSDGNEALVLSTYAYRMIAEITYTIEGTEISGSYNLRSYYDFALKKSESLLKIVERLWKYSESAASYRDELIAQQGGK